MPRAPKAPAANGDVEPRRSSRIKDLEKDKPAAPVKKKVTKPRVPKDKKENEPKKDSPSGKKRSAEEKEDAAEDAAEEPAPKKAKAGSVKPASKTSRAGSAKPSSKAKADKKEEEANKDEAGPETIPEEADEEDEEVKPLDIGDVLPDITLKTEKDEDVSIKGLADETGVVLFLFPKADTPGCTKQACGFRDVFSEFSEHGYTVYGLSGDAPAATLKWQTKNTLPYSFLSDTKKELIKALGALNGKSVKRSHFIFEKGGKLVDKKLPVKPEESPTKALDFIKSQKAEDA